VSASKPKPRRIIVCADDFGLSQAACQSILQLGATGALNATSCAVDGPYVAEHLPALRALRPALAVGLHLNLTENAQFAGARPLTGWLAATYLRWQLDPAALRSEIARQLQRFETLFGTPPDFVDGHEHVHQFPVIRDLLLTELQQRAHTRLWVRCTWPQRYRGAKAAVIGLLGARALRRQLRLQGLRHNSDFAGVYDLVGEHGYDTRMRSWLAGLEDGGMIMCHPELPGPHTSPARAAEHRYLASPQWLALQEEARVSLTSTPS
jgi:hypothetical protein